MKAEAIEKLEELVRASEAKVIYVDGVSYSTRQIHDLRKKEPEPETLVVHSLQAVVDYIAGNRDGLELGECVLHIVGPQQVDLRSRISGHFQQRPTFVRGVATDLTEGASLKLGRFHPVEEVVIGLQALFVDSPERREVIRVLGNVKGELVTTQVDNGMTQEVSVRAGALTDKLEVPNPVSLAPYRTFREVEQPSSPVVLRVKKTENGIVVGLFEADGGAWRLAAVKRIRDWLQAAGVGPVAILG